MVKQRKTKTLIIKLARKDTNQRRCKMPQERKKERKKERRKEEEEEGTIVG